MAKCLLCQRERGKAAQWFTISSWDVWEDAWEESDKKLSEELVDTNPFYRTNEDGGLVQVRICVSCYRELAYQMFRQHLDAFASVFVTEEHCDAFEAGLRAYLMAWMDEDEETGVSLSQDIELEDDQLTQFLEIIMGGRPIQLSVSARFKIGESE